MFYPLIPLTGLLLAALYGIASYESRQNETKAVRMARDTVAACSIPNGSLRLAPERCEGATRVATYGARYPAREIAVMEVCEARTMAPGKPSAEFKAACDEASQSLAALRANANEVAGADEPTAAKPRQAADGPLGWRLIAISTATTAATLWLALWISSFFKRRRKDATAP